MHSANTQTSCIPILSYWPASISISTLKIEIAFLLTRPEDFLDPGNRVAGVSSAGSGTSGWLSFNCIVILLCRITRKLCAELFLGWNSYDILTGSYRFMMSLCVLSSFTPVVRVNSSPRAQRSCSCSSRSIGNPCSPLSPHRSLQTSPGIRSNKTVAWQWW